MKPDISINKGNKAIIDTKYKILSRSKKKKDKFNISQNDLYQMYAYCKEYGANKCLLIYPEGYTLNDAVGKSSNKLNWKSVYSQWTLPLELITAFSITSYCPKPSAMSLTQLSVIE